MSLILVDKPAGPTSHAVVATIKRALKADKVGHLGTLDPFASGLLPIMIGNTARLSDEAMDGRKGYLFTIGFGQETDTLDPTGRVILEAALPTDISPTKITQVIQQFTGPIEQVPPVYSALKLNGMPLYEYMRGTGQLPIDIESKRRTITIHSLDVIEVTHESMIVRVVCSKGTYVRSLARDIAKALGSVGTCVQLRREMVEPWHVDDALKLELDSTGRIVAPDKETLIQKSLPPWSVAANLPRAKISDELEFRLQSGNPLNLSDVDIEWTNQKAQSSEDSQTPGQEHAINLSLAEPESEKIFVSCGTTLFLCDATRVSSQDWKIQPRKRIQ